MEERETRRMKKGYVQIYTGNGKGKTTCMLGLALRASGAGKKIFIGQFLKQGDYSEIKAIKKFLPDITLEQFGAGGKCFAKGSESENDISAAKEGYQHALHAVSSGEYDLVILDEINVAVSMELLTEEQQLRLMEQKSEGTELVMTGRYASEKIIERADLVTEMTMIKHYFNDGVNARVGIEM